MRDTLESLLNAVLGLLISWICVLFLWPLWGWNASGADAVGVTAVFFALSFVRSRLLRALFRSME